MDSLRELDADGNAIGNTGSPSIKHSINTFAAQDFVISDITPSTYADGEDSDGNALDTFVITFNTQLVGDSDLTIETIVFADEGRIWFGDCEDGESDGASHVAGRSRSARQSRLPIATADLCEVTDVSPGMTKFNVAMNDWTFCDGEGGNPCQVRHSACGVCECVN